MIFFKIALVISVVKITSRMLFDSIGITHSDFRDMLDAGILILGASPALHFLIVKPYIKTSHPVEEHAVELRQTAEQLKYVLQGSDLGFWDWNIVTNEVQRNARWAEMLGYTYEELKNTTKQWTDFIYPDDRELAWHSINDVLEGRSSSHKAEYRMLHKDGSIRWILDQANVIQRSHDGKPMRMSGTHTDITDRKQLEHKLELQAHSDFLTGLCSRGYFMEQAESELLRSVRYNHHISLIMMDIDFFKQVNDTHGHKAGDLVLKKLAEVTRLTMRGVDIIGRLGGEEFAILLPETGLDEAEEVAERLREALATAKVPMQSGGLPLHFTVSIGVASLSSPDDNLDVLLSLADRALYQAKKSGRNMVCASA